MTAATIYALSSGAPPAAVAVLRVSGPAAAQALTALAGSLPEPRRASLRSLVDPQNDAALDRALVLWFPGPASATGEDLAELHLHGGRAVVARVAAALAAIPGLRPAEPGEFTRRAFEKGRIDLAEAEGLADLLAAETESQRLSALAMAGGALSREVEAWQDRLLMLSARAEAQLDFADEGDVASDDALTTDIAALRAEIAERLERPHGERLREGVRVAIAGPPNAGKSTLINALAGREAAITSPLPGTTRDLIEVPLALGGRPFLFIDTAGLHAGTGDAIEAIGISRAREALEASDIILWLDDSELADPRAIHVYARSDLPGRDAPLPRSDVTVSALTGAGLDALETLLMQRADTLLPRVGEVSINRRQRDLLTECHEALLSHPDPLILAESLRLARGALDRLTGRAGTESMLDALFGRFCIGK